MEPVEALSLLLRALDPTAPQVQLTGNAMILIEDNDGK